MRIFLLTLQMLLVLASAAHAGVPDELARRYREALAAYEARPANPLDVTIETGKGKPARAVIGAAGGEVRLETKEAVFTLRLPEDALFYPEAITLVPVTKVDGLGEEATGVLAVKIEPSGLPLAGPGWLNIRPKQKDVFEQAVFPFGFSGDGRNAHYSLLRPEEDGSVSVMVTHFSGFGTGLGTAATQALSQSKPALPPPDANKTARDAAAIGQETHGLWGAAADATAGEGDVKSGFSLTAFITGLISGASGDEKPVTIRQIDVSHCVPLSGMISYLNTKRAAYPATAPQDQKPKLQPSDWDIIKACAKPPADTCFSTGNPWPLAAYLKELRAYRPDPEEAAEFRRVEAWLEGLLKSCARYVAGVTTKSEVEDKNAILRFIHASSIVVTIDLARLDGKSRDVFTGSDKGQVVSALMRCNMKGVNCKVESTSVLEPAQMQVDLADLPFDTNMVPGVGGTKTGTFDPAIMPAQAFLDAVIKAKGMGVPIQYEMVGSFWRCNFKKEYMGPETGFRFGAWSKGSYPMLYEFKPGRRSAKCEGRRALGAELLLEFEHIPDGSFKPFE